MVKVNETERQAIHQIIQAINTLLSMVQGPGYSQLEEEVRQRLAEAEELLEHTD